MASLNLSINGPSIKSSYQSVVNGPAPSSSSPTFAHWALFSVQAPLLNAFQDSGAKESILKVESTGEGELADLVEDFNEGRIQFAYVKVKDPNTGLPKNVLIAWCGGGVPERTKGYFTSHVAAVAKVLHGYHVQITARSDSDLEPANIIQKVSDASGAKYTAGGSAPSPAPAAPPVAKKPVFTPTTSSTGGSFNPLVAARNRRNENVDEDGWGADAPQVSRTEIQKVESAYKPTKVNIAELRAGHQESTRFNGSSKQDDTPSDVVRGGYQPIGKVDIAAIRAAAQNKDDLRPTPVKGSYEPVGKVDIAAIRARSQKPAEEEKPESPRSQSLADRSAAFSQPAQSERLTSLPKPKVANKFGGAGSFTGTKAPTPGGIGGFGAPAAPAAPPVGAASRTFADQGGKTPAQIWAEKKARERGASGSGAAISPPAASPVTAQKSGSEWKSGYSGKSWAAVQTPAYGRAIPGQKTGETERSDRSAEPEQAPTSPGGGVSALRDRFKEAPPMGGAAPAIPRAATGASEDEPAPPPPPMASRPSGPTGGFALPGLPSRPPPADEQEEEEDSRAFEEQSRAIEERDPSPIRVAVPVPRTEEPEFEPPAERLPERPIPVPQIEREVPKEAELPREEESFDPRAAAAAVATGAFGHQQAEESHEAASGGKRAVIQYDYDKAEDNEIDLKEGDYVTNIEMVDDDWWMGTNSKGESGLFPSNYVELVDDDDEAPAPATQAAVPPPPPAAEPEPSPAAPAGGAGGPTATALFDYEAAEDNELSFEEGAKIEDLEFPDEDWWFGHYKGKSGLFPANYVQLDS
ncbi:putative amylase-binding protein [Phaeoacremonium minimum UCRPA7]|uniref:Putative amylase-binding protein n=1 Tax=Phaeoacremonium minimum (strain UCR-PA7) TaxID=1286976 RepID=R8BC37_PHAM7|nr:putative amylase-binding protein [Phaeoacremonium minimum UCRPA7]EON96868.1 putative amylase-binding protein [Phaeoacremonium minimum UCRPA7]